jgi:chromosomal replication initiator protein
MNSWDQIRNYLQRKVSAESFHNWLKNTEFIAMDGNTLCVSVPDGSTRSWLETEYANLVSGGISELQLPVGDVSYEVRASRATQNHVAPTAEAVEESTALLLNPKFTFESFLVGS